MKLDYLGIQSFKNLRDFAVSFDQSSQELFAVFLGRNGLGKSNLLEALVVIFRDLFRGHATSFGYELRYTLKRGTVRVHVVNVVKSASTSPSFEFTVQVEGGDSIQVRRDELKEEAGRAWLPRHVFAYYSGPSDRLEEHFRPQQRQFYRDLLKGKVSPFRPMFYARPVHSNFVLLAFFTKDDAVVDTFLKDRLGIEGLESVLFVLKRPTWKGQPDGDPRFWKATGTVQRFLSRLWDLSLAPLRVAGTVPDGFGPPQKTEFLYLYLRDAAQLRSLAEQSDTSAEFFKQLESTYMSSLIHETRIRVKVRDLNGSLTFRELSEGEQQLLTVVGLLRFTKEEESLFLLDEPDTHLNPAWGMEYLETLETIADTGVDSQILIATHDPLMISGLRKEQVLVLEKDAETNQITSQHPEIDPRGMGVSGILKSSMFGLRTTLDLPTQAKLDERFELVANENRNLEEDARLKALSEELADDGFASDFRDDNYHRYAVAVGKVRAAGRLSLTTDEIRELDRQALEAVQKLTNGIEGE